MHHDPRIDKAVERALSLGEVGIQVAAYLGDELIVDVGAGLSDTVSGTAVDTETLFPVFSVTKAVTATALHLQAERGLIGYDDPVARHWPEFAAHGKEGITVLHILTHRTGAPQMPPGTTPERLADWEWVTAGLADLIPLHAPGERSIYHALSFGYLVAELVRRTDPAHRPFGTFVREELGAPLDAPDLWIGLPETLEQRVATLIPPKPGSGAQGPGRDLTMPPPVSPGRVYNTTQMHRVCNPGAGGIMTARSAARLFSLLASGGTAAGQRLLSEDRVESFLTPRPRPDEADDVLMHVTPVGIGGYWLSGDHAPPVVGSPRVMFHPGAGGSIGWADLNRGLAVAICHNRMFASPTTYPFDEIGEAVRVLADDVAA